MSETPASPHPSLPSDAHPNLAQRTAPNAAPDPDPGVSFDRSTGKWIYEPLAGTDDPTLEWDLLGQRWVPALEERPSTNPSDAAPGAASGSSKRKRAGKDREAVNSKKTKASDEQKRANAKPRPVASVFISGLPHDTSVPELADVFSRYGVLLEDEPGKPRVKLYYDDEGKFKGEALITYFKPDSVEIAIAVLDQSPLRIGTSKPLMSVERAQFKEPPADTSTSVSQIAQESGGDASGPKQRSEEEKRRIKDRNRRLNEWVDMCLYSAYLRKLNDWDSEEEDVSDPRGESVAALAPYEAGGRTVVLKHMFTLSELEEEPELLLDLKTDVREECERITAPGAVTNVILYDKEPEGVMSVRFTLPEAAQACVDKMHGRWFAQRKVEAYITAAVRPKFARSGVRGEDEDEAAQEEHARTEAFGHWLEASDDEEDGRTARKQEPQQEEQKEN